MVCVLCEMWVEWEKQENDVGVAGHDCGGVWTGCGRGGDMMWEGWGQGVGGAMFSTRGV